MLRGPADGGALDPDIRLPKGHRRRAALSEVLRPRESPQFIDCRRATRCNVPSRSAAGLKCCEVDEGAFDSNFLLKKPGAIVMQSLKTKRRQFPKLIFEE